MKRRYLLLFLLFTGLFLVPAGTPQAQSTLMDTCHYFPETQQQVCGLIFYRFRAEGVEQDGQPGYSIAENVAKFGYPTGPQYTEGSKTIQHFQRAIFEYETYLAPNAPVTVLITAAPATGTQPPPANEPPPPQETVSETLPSPEVIGPSANGETAITVINDSTQPLRLMLDGPERVWIDVPACIECTDYTTPPAQCRSIAPSRRQVVQPGTYTVRTLEDAGVIPLGGNWNLDPGLEYNLCLFIVY